MQSGDVKSLRDRWLSDLACNYFQLFTWRLKWCGDIAATIEGLNRIEVRTPMAIPSKCFGGILLTSDNVFVYRLVVSLTNKELLIMEISNAPEELVDEVLELIQKFRTSRLSESETALLSEESLKNGWIGEEEDEAWKHL